MSAVAEIAPERLEQHLERLRRDTVFYARNLVKIVDKARVLRALDPRPAQLKLQAAIDKQQAEGLPVRVIVLKSRKTGISTWVQARALQRTTLNAHERAIVVAQDSATASELFGISDRAYGYLPDDPVLPVKPPIRNVKHGRMLWFGEESPSARRRGAPDLDSVLRVDTAREVQAGRGFTYFFMHLSEVAFWQDPRKLTTLLNAMDENPATEIIVESTANGTNHFKRMWERAWRGESGYEPVFISWLEDPDCWRRFRKPEDREEFEKTVGQGEYGAEEPELMEVYGATLEQLHWRRWAISDKADGSLDTFHQEYPATWEQAFLASGKQVFDKVLIARVHKAVERTDPKVPTGERHEARPGIFRVAEQNWTDRRGVHGTFKLPTAVDFVPASETGLGIAHPYWRLWGRPDPGLQKDTPCPRCSTPGQECDLCAGSTRVQVERPRGAYVIGTDPMSGEETGAGEQAYNGLVIIDHRSKVQVGEMRQRWDADQVAIELLKAAMYWNDAHIAVEVTGGYGQSIVNRLFHDYGWINVFIRKREEHLAQPISELLGWYTSPATKPLLEDRARELLRTQTHGIRSRRIANELSTYVRLNERGKTGPDLEAFADLLMAWMIAQHVSTISIPPLGKKPKQVSSTRRANLTRRRA